MNFILIRLKRISLSLYNRQAFTRFSLIDSIPNRKMRNVTRPPIHTRNLAPPFLLTDSNFRLSYDVYSSYHH